MAKSINSASINGYGGPIVYAYSTVDCAIEATASVVKIIPSEAEVVISTDLTASPDKLSGVVAVVETALSLSPTATRIIFASANIQTEIRVRPQSQLLAFANIPVVMHFHAVPNAVMAEADFALSMGLDLSPTREISTEANIELTTGGVVSCVRYAMSGASVNISMAPAASPDVKRDGDSYWQCEGASTVETSLEIWNSNPFVFAYLSLVEVLVSLDGEATRTQRPIADIKLNTDCSFAASRIVNGEADILFAPGVSADILRTATAGAEIVSGADIAHLSPYAIRPVTANTQAVMTLDGAPVRMKPVSSHVKINTQFDALCHFEFFPDANITTPFSFYLDDEKIVFGEHGEVNVPIIFTIFASGQFVHLSSSEIATRIFLDSPDAFANVTVKADECRRLYVETEDRAVIVDEEDRVIQVEC